jgi:hypothetical protein
MTLPKISKLIVLSVLVACSSAANSAVDVGPGGASDTAPVLATDVLTDEVVADVVLAPDSAGGVDAAGGSDTATAGDDAADVAATDLADTDPADTGVAVTDAGPDATTPTSLALFFVGNSYTFVNDLPGRVKAVLTAQTAAVTTRVDSQTVPGAMLGVFADDTALPDRVANGAFDYVVLQAQSVEPVAYPEWFFEAAQSLGAMITKAGPKILYYATWARAPGDAVYDEAWSGGTAEAMTAGLEDAYVTAASLTGGTVVPVGRAFAMARVSAPDLGLYASDGSHPSPAGTYLAACTFAVVLLGAAPDAVGAPDGLSATDAARLRDVAVQAVAAFLAE